MEGLKFLASEQITAMAPEIYEKDLGILSTNKKRLLVQIEIMLQLTRIANSLQKND